MAGPVEVEWSLDALADLDRFTSFLHGQVPELAALVASELIAELTFSVGIRSWGDP